MKRVVVTGLGLVTPLGCGVQNVWNALLAGKCGITKLDGAEYDQIPSKVAARVPEFRPEDYVPKNELRSMSPASLYALAASTEAIRDAGLGDLDSHKELRKKIGVAIGMGMSDLEYIVQTAYILRDKGPNKISPYFVPRILTNMAAGIVSMKFGLEGPNHSVSTACATGAHSIGDAANFIRHGKATAMVCGGTESCVTPLSLAGFCRLRALSTKYNDQPSKASRPFDNQRDGFVMGEGAGIMFLEDLDHALHRKAPRIYGEILGYGMSGDASHLTAPSIDGAGAFRAMSNALEDAGVQADQIGFVNAHATSTPMGDAIELNAIAQLPFASDNKPWISSMKGALGHGQGAAGAMESCLSILAARDGVLPPNLNLEQLDDSTTRLLDRIQLTPGSQSVPWTLRTDQDRRILLKNSFGFGGTNASLCIASYHP